ncbi:hypothetical protein TWF506_000591 [Arthrobotrys conoides]|uniref:Uncharacterized protein n=1 Tax=Arthrobotrys conoides TaxID=74498 RepID=A0AAN8NLW7_9PEZI
MILKLIPSLMLLLSIGCTIGARQLSKDSKWWQAFRWSTVACCWIGAPTAVVSGYCWASLATRREKQKMHGTNVWEKRNWFLESAWWDLIIAIFLAVWSAGFILPIWA